MNQINIAYIPQNEQEEEQKLKTMLEMVKGVPAVYRLVVIEKMLDLSHQHKLSEKVAQVLEDAVTSAEFENPNDIADDDRWAEKNGWNVDDGDSPINKAERIGGDLAVGVHYGEESTRQFCLEIVKETVMKGWITMELYKILG